MASLRGRFPRPTNALALAALEGVPQWTDASNAIAGGFPALASQQYMAPDGVLPRMRLIACGWLTPGDSFRRPEDGAWWQSPYRYALWPQLATYATLVDQIDPRVRHVMTWDEQVAAGDSGAISQSLQLTVAELKDVLEAPCPRWIIPPSGGLPVANPECARKDRDKLRDELDKVHPAPSSSSSLWWVLLLVGLAYAVGKKRR